MFLQGTTSTRAVGQECTNRSIWAIRKSTRVCSRREAETKTSGLSCHQLFCLLVYGHRLGSRRDAVRDHDQTAGAGLDASGQSEMSGLRFGASLNRVAARFRCPGIKNVLACVVGNTDQRVVSGILEIIAVRSPVREAAQLRSLDYIRLSGSERGRYRCDRRLPRCIVGSLRGEYFNILAVVGEQYLAGRKFEEVSVERRVARRLGWAGELRQCLPVPLKEDGTNAKDRGAGHYDDVAVNFKG